MTEFGVRPATLADLADVGRITFEAYDAGPGAGTPDYVKVLRDSQSRFDHASLYVAESDATVVATMTLAGPGTMHSEIAQDHELEVRYLAVDPAWWGKGIAKLLIAQARVDASAAHSYLVLDVITHNAKAHDMYRALGFVRAPHRDFVPVPNVYLEAYEDATSPYWQGERPAD